MNLDELMKANKEMFESWVKENGGLNTDQLQVDFLVYIKINLNLTETCILTVTEYNNL